jgi:hypothetical protein
LRPVSIPESGKLFQDLSFHHLESTSIRQKRSRKPKVGRRRKFQVKRFKIQVVQDLTAEDAEGVEIRPEAFSLLTVLRELHVLSGRFFLLGT